MKNLFECMQARLGATNVERRRITGIPASSSCEGGFYRTDACELGAVSWYAGCIKRDNTMEVGILDSSLSAVFFAGWAVLRKWSSFYDKRDHLKRFLRS